MMSEAAVEEFVKKGVVVAGTRTDIARVGIGVAVREGAPPPRYFHSRGVKKDPPLCKVSGLYGPSKGGTSGIHFAGVLERLGIADAVKSKTTLWPSGYAAEPVAKGEVEICIHQISEILAVKRVTLVGPLPRELQKITVYSAGLGAGTASPDAAKAFIQFLTSPKAKSKFISVGLDYKE